MSASPEHLIIEGDFKPSRAAKMYSRIGRIGLKLGIALLAVIVVAALGIYSVTVHYQSRINQLSSRARDVSEENRELEVKLGRIRSFKNIEAAAAKAPHLRLPEEVLEIKAPAKADLPELPLDKPEVPQVYGY